jgi:hypothetical protein
VDLRPISVKNETVGRGRVGWVGVGVADHDVMIRQMIISGALGKAVSGSYSILDDSVRFLSTSLCLVDKDSGPCVRGRAHTLANPWLEGDLWRACEYR